MRMQFYLKRKQWTKRFLDLFFSGLAVLLLLPLLMIIVVLIAMRMGFPLFFRQQRPGLHEKTFTMLKFRTMTIETYDKNEHLLPDEKRLTRLGAFLRATSLDELPEIWNVLKGDMSLVGPRPLLTEYLPLYTSEQRRRHTVKPGITGWAQINGRNQLSWEDKFKLDVWYVDNQSLWLDLKIIYLTFRKVWKREGISLDGHATTEKFTGS